MMKNIIILLSVLSLFIANSFAQGKRLFSLLPTPGIERGRDSLDFEEKEFLKDKNSINQNNRIAYLAQIQEQEQVSVVAFMSQFFIDGIWVNNGKEAYVYDVNGNQTEYMLQIWQNDAWVNDYKHIYEYNANGNQTEEIVQFWRNDAWVNDQNEIYMYEANGNQTEYLRQKWQNDVWVNDEKEIYTYDENGNRTEKLRQKWQNDVWENDWRYTYMYDANGNQTESLRQKWQNEVWVNSKKHSYAYDENGNQTEYLRQIWMGEDWWNMSKNTYAYDISGNLTEDLDQSWNGDTWVDYQKRNYEYDINGNLIEYIIQNGNEGILETSMKYSYKYDANGNQTEDLLQIWENDVWVNYSIYNYAYDTSGNLKGFLGQEWKDDAWVNSSRFLYAYEKCAPAIFDISDITIDTTSSFSYTVWALGSPPPLYTLVKSPAEMTLNDSTGLITWDPELGTYQIIVRVENAYGSSDVSFELIVDPIETDIEDNKNYLEPTKFSLTQNYPNPFNSSTKISYSIPTSGFVTLKIYNLLGKEIHTLISEFQQPNTYSIYFDASKLASGIYFYRLQVGSDFMETKRMLLMR